MDLCGGTGAWSEPYKQAGYDVRVISGPTHDVRIWEPPDRVWGVLAAPPCEHFSVSGAQYWPAKDADSRTLVALSIVDACIRIIHKTRPAWWALENPVGRLGRWLGPPVFSFQPCDYGDAYTKKTMLWGNFNHDLKQAPVEPVFIRDSVRGRKYSPVHWGTGGKSAKTKELRSITPPGFAKAFFEANP